MNTASPRVLLISGSSGTGKSTLSRLVAERFRFGACIDGDLIAGWIVAGGRPPRIEARSSESKSFDSETDRQLNVRFRVLGVMARTYAESGFSVMIDAFFAEPWVWQCLDHLEGWETHGHDRSASLCQIRSDPRTGYGTSSRGVRSARGCSFGRATEGPRPLARRFANEAG